MQATDLVVNLVCLCVCVRAALWPASQSESSLYPLQHDHETEAGCDGKGNRSLDCEEQQGHQLHISSISTALFYLFVYFKLVSISPLSFMTV